MQLYYYRIDRRHPVRVVHCGMPRVSKRDRSPTGIDFGAGLGVSAEGFSEISNTAHISDLTPEQRSSAKSSRKLTPGLYVVATPIGNLADITLRALSILSSVDVIACEDTRVTRKLLAKHGISNRLTSYHEHNARRSGRRLLNRLINGEAVALVSDAGTPLVSDPGYRLVLEARREGVLVVPIPGPSIVTAALSVSGLPTDRFMFVGFLPSRKGERLRVINEFRDIKATLVLFESSRRLAATLCDLWSVLGKRSAVVAREVTKRFEESRSDMLDSLAEYYSNTSPPRGEIIVLVGPPEKNRGVDCKFSDVEIDAQIEAALEHHPLTNVASLVASATGLPRREVYSRAVKVKKRE